MASKDCFSVWLSYRNRVEWASGLRWISRAQSGEGNCD